MTDNTFQKVGKSEKRMFGPPCILVCGYGADEQEGIVALMETCGLGHHPIVFAATTDGETILRDLVQGPSGQGKGRASDLSRAIIMSGFTENELHALLSGYRGQGLPPQLWATLTPVSQGWTLNGLLQELSAEAAAFRKRQQEQETVTSSGPDSQK